MQLSACGLRSKPSKLYWHCIWQKPKIFKASTCDLLNSVLVLKCCNQKHYSHPILLERKALQPACSSFLKWGLLHRCCDIPMVTTSIRWENWRLAALDQGRGMCVGSSNEHTSLATQADATGGHPHRLEVKMTWVNEGWLKNASCFLHFTILCAAIMHVRHATSSVLVEVDIV